MRACYSILASVVCGTLLSLPAAAAPVQWTIADGGNGHFYERVDSPDITWTLAKTAAESFGGGTGYLATVTSQAESDFLLAHVNVNPPGFTEFWLGGFQNLIAPDYAEPAGGWQWVTAEPFVFTNWGLNQPNQEAERAEDYLSTRGNQPWKWNDLYVDGPNIAGYVVEYQSVPEPSTLALGFTGLCAVTAWGYLRRRGGRRGR